VHEIFFRRRYRILGWEKQGLKPSERKPALPPGLKPIPFNEA
jgi:hypothetical protein